MEATQLKIRRIKAGLRQYELAARLGVTQTKLSQIECGRTKASPELIRRILIATQDTGGDNEIGS